MTLRVLLADDEPLALVRLEALLAQMAHVTIVGTARDGEEAAAQIEALKPDLALLDIRMPKQSGLSLAKALRETNDVDVVFITAFDQFALQAFEVDAVDYLLKPVEAHRLAIALDRARRRRSAVAVPGIADPTADAAHQDDSSARVGVQYIWAPHRGGLVRVDVSSIDWIEAARDYVLLHTSTRSHMVRATMESLKDQIDPTTMVRVSRSAFVRRAAVQQINRQGRASHVVVLRDGTAVRVGVTYARAVMAAFNTESVVAPAL